MNFNPLFKGLCVLICEMRYSQKHRCSDAAKERYDKMQYANVTGWKLITSHSAELHII